MTKIRRDKRDKKVDRAGEQEQKVDGHPLPARHRMATGGAKKG